MDLALTAHAAAEMIADRFDGYHQTFQRITRQVEAGFAARDWQAVRRLTVERLDLQSEHVRLALAEVTELLERERHPAARRATWSTLKAAYAEEVLGRDDVELAKTFFNSLTRKVFSHVGVDPEIDFQDEDIPLPYAGWEMASARMYAVQRVTPALVRRLLEDARFSTPFSDLGGDARRAAAAIERGLEAAWGDTDLEAIDLLRPVFFRNKGAYLVGRARRGDELMPLALAIVHREDGTGGEEASGEADMETRGLVVDAVLPTEDEISIVFSFARWYFHVEVASPREVIGFLHSILPRKRLAELYSSLGYVKHAKTELYRDLVGQVESSRGRFQIAPGKRGLVMAVFTLPDFEFVFKVIKDRFPPQKPFDRAQVEESYRHVLRRDRVGRMVDFQEFEHLPLPRERFTEELLEELLDVAGETVEVEGDQVVLHHVYVERRVTPLDLYLDQESDARACSAVVEYGWCIKDLAASNVFSGDLLLKNFGVTRHGRVVFYDYDEVATLTDLTFREMPEARDPLQEMAAEPWFSVAETDVFPEEFGRFLGLYGELRETFDEHHGDLLAVSFWRSMQERSAAGEVIDFFPYGEERRLLA